MTAAFTCDILIIGAGPAGLAFARAMAETGLKITLIEKSGEDVLADPPYDGREIALTHLSHKIMQDLGILKLIPKDQISLIRAARVMNSSAPEILSFDPDDAGRENLGFMVANHMIRKAAFKALSPYKNVRFITGHEVRHVETDATKGWVELDDGRTLTAPLIVAADSRFSASRRLMGIPVSTIEFGRTCIVCTMTTAKPHHETAYECFHDDRTLALLPLQKNKVSVVITLASREKDHVLGMDPVALAADIERRAEGRLGTMKLSSKLYSYPLVATFAKTFHTRRFAVIGDAAVGMHPVTAHGFNLGLRGGYTLATEIQNALSLGEDFAAPSVLARYSRVHRRTCAPLYHGTNVLVRLYTNNTPLAHVARRALIGIGNHLPPAKKLIVNQLTETRAV